MGWHGRAINQLDKGFRMAARRGKESRLMKTLNLCLLAASMFGLAIPVPAGEIPRAYLNHTVAIGRKDAHGNCTEEATGFFYGKFDHKESADRNAYNGFLVTNRHVIEEHMAATSGGPLSVRINKKNGRLEEVDFPLDINGVPTWHAHPDQGVDLAVVRINGTWFEQNGVEFGFFRGDMDALSRAKAKDLGLSEGLGVFVVGFPMSLVGQSQDYPIVRQGSIARVRDSLESPNSVKSFLIDCFIFPGNSGSPVVLRPEDLLAQFAGEKPPIRAAYLIGLVSSYIPYTDVAVSVQTKRPRVTFEENSGLTQVIPVDYIDETIEDFGK